MKRGDEFPFCYDCGEPTHLAGSNAWPSPSFLTEKRMMERQAQNGSSSQAIKTIGGPNTNQGVSCNTTVIAVWVFSEALAHRIAIMLRSIG